ETARVTAAGHAADEHALIEEAIAHPDAIAEDRAAGERARRIHRHDRHAVVALPVLGCEPRDERALAAAGRPGDTDAARAACLGIEGAKDVGAPALIVLDDGQERREPPL